MDGGSSNVVRASDDERDRVLRVLGDHVAHGRMSHDTFQRRVDLVLRARSRAELDEAVRDLPPPGRLTGRLTSLISAVSMLTLRAESAWRAPRLPRFTLPGPETSRLTVGRAPGCGVLLSDVTVSRWHAEIDRDGDGWLVRDLSSMNGTRINGRRLTGPTRIRPGDEIGFGEARFVAAAP